MKCLVMMCVLVAGASAVPSSYWRGIVGNSGIIKPDGNNIQFTREQAENIVLVGPSGIVTKDGRNIQLTDDRDLFHRSKSSADYWRGIVGNSGIIKPDGNNIQFTREQAENIILVGPSGIVTKDGRNIQLTDDRDLFHRSKRSAGFVSAAGNIGYSGILRADGSTDLFSHDQAHNIVLIGPSGIVTKDGRNMQLTDDLRIVHHNKRHLIGASGMITNDGIPIQFKHAGVTILLEGPSGYIMSDGTLVQKRSKRAATYGHAIGASGIVTKSGKQIQLPHGVTVVLAGPSGAVLSNGQNIQF